MISVAMLVAIVVFFVTVAIPAFEFGGRDQIPSDLPVYPGAKLDYAFAGGFGDCTDVNATWSTTAPAAQVTAFYKAHLSTGAWTLTDSTPVPGGVALSFTGTSGPHREGELTVSKTAGGGSEISLQLAKGRSSTTTASDCHVVVGQTG